MAVSAGARLGPYEILEPLGAGGMGQVYRARDPRLDRDVALKVLRPEVASDPDRLRRFEREAKTVAALNHPHILTVFDVGTHDGTPYVVTELLEGETLRQVLKTRAPTQTQVLTFAVQIARGLAAAHDKDIVHRDLKPENLFLTTDARIKILDFGLAKLTTPEADFRSADTLGASEAHSTSPGVILGTVAYMSPEQAQAHPLDNRSDIFSFGVVLYEMLARRHPFLRDTAPATLTAIVTETPVDLASSGCSIPPALAGIVHRCLEKGKQDRFRGTHDLALALEAVLQAPSGAASLQEVEERSPYPGLSSFTEKDAAVFFGREGEVEALWKKLRSRNLLAVIGPSGAGKSSFVRAGVLPARPEGWAALVCTPGRHPFRRLGQALAPALHGDPEALTKLVSFEEPDTAVELVTLWRKAHAEAVVVVDQFEELFTQSPPEAQALFADLLGWISKEADVHVLLSLRDDFLMRCHQHEPLARVFSELTPLDTLSRDGLRRAITEPAKKQGYTFEDDALVDEMVDSVEGARGALPLLAFAVSQLWERRDRETKQLTRKAYEKIAGVAGALAQHAEQTLERIGAERQGMAREIFRNLVTSQGTRATSDREELLSVFPDREAAEGVLDALIDARLLTSYEAGGPELSSRGASAEAGDEGSAAPSGRVHRIEIIHESLLKAWPRLVWWQAQDEEGTHLRDQLKQAAHLWEEKGRSPDLLWSGTAFREFELWRERYPGRLTAVEDDYATAMVERVRRRRRLRRLAAGGVVAASLAVAAVVGVSRQQVADEALRAEASKLLALAQARLRDDPTEALALTTASLGLADTLEARAFAVKTLWESPPALEAQGTSPYLTQNMAFSPDGERLSVAGWDPDVRVWAEDGKAPAALQGHTPSPFNVGAWASDRLLVTGPFLWEGTRARRAHVWSFPEAKRERTIDFGGDTWWRVEAERLLAVTVERGTVSRVETLLLRAWRLPHGNPEVLGRIDIAPDTPWQSLAFGSGALFAPEGRSWLYAKERAVYLRRLPVTEGREDEVLTRHDGEAILGFPRSQPHRVLSRDALSGEIRVWSFEDRQPVLAKLMPRPETAPDEAIRSLWPGASGRHLVDGRLHDNAEVYLWDTASLPEAQPLILRRTGSWLHAHHAFHPAGKWIVAATHQTSRLTFWPMRWTTPIVVDGYRALVRPVAFSHDGRWLASNWPEGGARLWRVPGSGPPEFRTLGGMGFRFAFDAADRFIFMPYGTYRPQIVPLDGSGARVLEIPNLAREWPGASVSPSGRTVASASYHGEGDTALALWDVDTGERRLFDLPEGTTEEAPDANDTPASLGYEDAVLSVHFVDETTLYTAGVAGVLRWDLESGTHETVFVPQPDTEVRIEVDAQVGVALARWHRLGTPLPTCKAFEILDLVSRTREPVTSFGDCPVAFALDPSGTVAVTGDFDGVVRVGRLSSGEPHLLLGHEGAIDSVAVSPDLRWVASSGEDNTLRLWPMPDLDKPPLHTLPQKELIAKLESLTNLRAVRDPDSPTGWTIELGPFPGWGDVPTW